mmetsp:Transcript_15961/g.20172  ORF Transcript_15961/g.20172 Transcript_15961/m.20172 type:complete len:241 (+) Transcript_15961:420-1142(+)|eukprot:CAMPEP_0170452798 /NCGR_PEP_ID=MMETSP0123-20130129/1577_1 /TAXON_ID=182087 /ORGANISM="Favella ehrenbergii, Strain Fehren 1" /LENGTH=240 /DNA_ID=CAMNT_0010714925 /DNA_START=331 /DNA_END=1053 /DNA_ORIENTATION=-
MHPVVEPGPDELAAVGPDVCTLPRHLVVDELTIVGRPILPDELANAVLLSLVIAAFVCGAVGPPLLTVTVVLIVLPLTNVGVAVRMVVGAAPVRHIVLPVADVVVAISMDHAPVPLLLILVEVTIVTSTIFPELGALSMTFIVRPLPRILHLLITGTNEHFTLHDDTHVARDCDPLVTLLISPFKVAELTQLYRHFLVLVRQVLETTTHSRGPTVEVIRTHMDFAELVNGLLLLLPCYPL